LKSTESEFILRFKSKAFTLYDEKGDLIDLLGKIRHLKELESTRVSCFYKVNGKLKPIRICAMKKEAKAAEQAKRKTKEKARRQQKKQATVETLELNEYIVLATSLDYDESNIFELYRARWQIELVFRRLKSIFGFAEVPSKNENSVKSWFYAVLFLAALCETIQKDSHFSPVQQTAKS
jgi:IS4 transposase